MRDTPDMRRGADPGVRWVRGACNTSWRVPVGEIRPLNTHRGLPVVEFQDLQNLEDFDNKKKRRPQQQMKGEGKNNINPVTAQARAVPTCAAVQQGPAPQLSNPSNYIKQSSTDLCGSTVGNVPCT